MLLTALHILQYCECTKPPEQIVGRCTCGAVGGLQVSSEWAQAKSEASQAKAAGDKNKQKSIGLVIRSLKQEMKELGQPIAIAFMTYVPQKRQLLPLHTMQSSSANIGGACFALADIAVVSLCPAGRKNDEKLSETAKRGLHLYVHAHWAGVVYCMCRNG